MVSLTITAIIAAACLLILRHVLNRSAPATAAVPGMSAKAAPPRSVDRASRPRRVERAEEKEEEGGWPPGFRDSLRAGIERVLSGGGTPADGRNPMPRMGYDYSADRINATLSSVGDMSNIHALQQLSRLLGDSAIGMGEISKIVMTDPVMAGRVLNAANSAYYRMLGKVDSVSHALMILGIVHTRSVLLHDGLMKALNLCDSRRKEALAGFWRHATLTATCASHLQGLFRGRHGGNAYTLGLLHDVGKYVILAIRGEDGKVDRWLDSGKTGREGLLEEDELFGINHAVISAGVLERWGLPVSVLRSVEYHHHPEMLEFGIADLDPEGQRQLVILYLADQIARWIDGGPGVAPKVDPIHESYHFLIDRERLWELLNDRKFVESVALAKALTAPAA